ncbi:MAG: mechanosensitive channel MscK [Halomonas sp.]|uniref:mechanosensitive channel MscK n=1 Tax=Halomonas sp. TaxID=1486246 RepID=UPI002ACE174C|nr:mechanosensitive channel MscK [Halomonas sp.]MDZ7852360.1 mechanosensitive channel MscK [Halomonas sp.]
MPALAQDVAAQEETPRGLPSREEIESRLAERLPAEGETVSEGVQRDIEALEAVLTGLDQIAQAEERLAALNERVEQAPTQLIRLERELVAEEEADLAISVSELDGLSLEELEDRQREAVSELKQLQDRLAEVNSQLIAAESLPERAQRGIAEAIQTIEQSRRALDEMEARDVPADDPRMQQQRVALRLAELQMQLHQRELATHTQLRELAQRRRDLLTGHIDRQSVMLTMLQSVIDRKRRIASEQAIADAARDDPLITAGHPVLERALKVNRDLSLELLRATERSSDMVRESILVRSQLDQVRQIQRSLDEQIRAIRGSLLLSRILREQRQSLPQTESLSDLNDEIADLRLRQFDLARQRDDLRQSERLASQRLTAAGVEITPALVESLQRLYQSRRELVDQLEQTYGNLLSTAIELQLNQQQTLENSRELRATIDEQRFWVASRRPLNLAWFGQLPSLFMLEWHEGEWRQILPGNWRLPTQEALWGLPLLLAAGLLLGLRRRIKARLMVLHGQIGRLHSDSQAHTPLAIVLNLLLAIPGPLLLAGIGAVLVADAQAGVVGMGKTLWHLALAWTVVAWARRLLVPDGVATRHFHWPVAYVTRLRGLLKWFGLALVPVLFIAILARDGEISLDVRPLALGLLIAGLLTMSLVQARLILAHTPFFGVNLFRLLLGLIFASAPLILVGLIISGYEYTALQLIGHFVITLYLLGLWILIEAAVVRGLAVAARRLAFKRALARRRAQAQESGEGNLELIEEPPLAMDEVNQQSLRLSKLALLIGFVLLLYMVWADLSSVFSYLEQVTIWGDADGEGADLVESALSLADFFTALLIFALMIMLARNLPGLLEVMVLSRLELKPGSAYAITSLLSYTIVATGLVMGLSSLGVSWNKLQWLVAALGVGLGFGLQEIFANFVSGLIILFEKPIRIGDTITIGNLTGTVKSIRIRATTVTDFDRMEIIIPNKTFVTDHLINWSLSDTVTRVILKYGVSFGSDHRLVHRLLRQTADENSRVLDDPEPEVLFMSYGDSSLNFELRIFVNSVTDRLFATDEINCRVVDLFAEHGLTIAFSQLDVWLHRADGTQKKIESVALGDPGTPEARPSEGMSNTGERNLGQGDGDGGGR